MHLPPSQLRRQNLKAQRDVPCILENKTKEDDSPIAWPLSQLHVELEKHHSEQHGGDSTRRNPSWLRNRKYMIFYTLLNVTVAALRKQEENDTDGGKKNKATAHI